jgi:pimeloyl-ACP methyl ester carboxylesterase
MEPVAHFISAWDGLKLHALEWRGGHRRLPLLCLPGIVRTAGDFAGVAQQLGEGRRIISPDYAGRGRSGRSADVARYAPEACLRDILDLCAALHLHRVGVIGTSFGGLLSMGLAAARPGLIGAVVLNDIGPDIGAGGAEFVRRFVGHDPALPDLEACVAYLRSVLPPLSLSTDEDWRTMARLTYAPDGGGLFHPLWDTRIARLLDGPRPDLWTLFGALSHVPLLMVRGVVSDILLPETVTRMQAERPDMRVVSVDGVGHAPTLSEPVAAQAVRAFVDRLE